tara:strand:- start:753 stop:956 length:204 start_codon:yes stop_codon:yes gene_type:complete
MNPIFGRFESYTMQDGRKVSRIPVDSHTYINVAKDVESRSWVNDRQWWLMIEQNGFTWLWDGQIMEG